MEGIQGWPTPTAQAHHFRGGVLFENDENAGASVSTKHKPSMKHQNGLSKSGKKGQAGSKVKQVVFEVMDGHKSKTPRAQTARRRVALGDISNKKTNDQDSTEGFRGAPLKTTTPATKKKKKTKKQREPDGILKNSEANFKPTLTEDSRRTDVGPKLVKQLRFQNDDILRENDTVPGEQKKSAQKKSNGLREKSSAKATLPESDRQDSTEFVDDVEYPAGRLWVEEQKILAQKEDFKLDMDNPDLNFDYSTLDDEIRAINLNARWSELERWEERCAEADSRMMNHIEEIMAADAAEVLEEISDEDEFDLNQDPHLQPSGWRYIPRDDISL